MKRFNVVIWQQISRTYDEMVDAESEQEAKEIVWDRINKGYEAASEKYMDSDTSVYDVSPPDAEAASAAAGGKV